MSNNGENCYIIQWKQVWRHELSSECSNAWYLNRETSYHKISFQVSPFSKLFPSFRNVQCQALYKITSVIMLDGIEIIILDYDHNELVQQFFNIYHRYVVLKVWEHIQTRTHTHPTPKHAHMPARTHTRRCCSNVITRSEEITCTSL
jgi:hypothetical protein